MNEDKQNYFKVIEGTTLYYEHYVKYLQKQLEANENMRKEAIKFIRDRTRLIKIIDKIDEFELDLYLKENEINELLNILNKVGVSDK